MIGYLGLGSNIGDRRGHLTRAVAELSNYGVTVLASSSVYETEPVGDVLDQREFLNACLQISTEHGPEDLLDVCKEVERTLGRESGGVRHGPRVIDIDLLLLGSLQYESKRLVLPHADLTSRRFVLVPLLELDPSLTAPGRGRLAGILERIGPGQAVAKAGPPLL